MESATTIPKYSPISSFKQLYLYNYLLTPAQFEKQTQTQITSNNDGG